MLQLCGLAPADLHLMLWMRLRMFEAMNLMKGGIDGISLISSQVPQPWDLCNSCYAWWNLLPLFLLTILEFLLKGFLKFVIYVQSFKRMLL